MIGGVEQPVKVAHFRLSYSRQMFVIAYPQETQEMVLDAHNQAFAFLGGVPKRMVYDNLKTSGAHHRSSAGKGEDWTDEFSL